MKPVIFYLFTHHLLPRTITAAVPMVLTHYGAEGKQNYDHAKTQNLQSVVEFLIFHNTPPSILRHFL